MELDDFSSGTSSRSTKLIHGGVRYLQKAILQLDFEQVNILLINLTLLVGFILTYLKLCLYFLSTGW